MSENTHNFLMTTKLKQVLILSYHYRTIQKKAGIRRHLQGIQTEDLSLKKIENFLSLD